MHSKILITWISLDRLNNSTYDAEGKILLFFFFPQGKNDSYSSY